MPEEQVLVQAINGDQDALSSLLRRYGPAARASLNGKIPRNWRSVLSEDDVMQVTYLSAFLHIDQFRSTDCGAFVVWLKRIACNNLQNAIKGLAAGKRVGSRRQVPGLTECDSSVALFDTLVGPDSTPSRRAGRREIQATMTDAISRLPEAYQQVVRLCDLEGLSAKEAATIMGRSEGAVYMLRARAHAQLREVLGANSDFLADWCEG